MKKLSNSLTLSSIKSRTSRSKPPRESNKHGNEFEKKVREAFDPLETTHPIQWERIIDSAAAGNIIRDAEADFRLRVKSGYQGLIYEFLIECKASVVENSFNRCFRSLIKTNQLALMRKHARAGVNCIYMFHAVNNREVEIWNMRDLRDSYYEKRTKFEGQPLVVIPDSRLKEFARRLVDNPSKFVQLLGAKT